MALLGGGPVIRVRTVLRKPDSEKWNPEEVKKMNATPRHPNPSNKVQKERNSVRETKGLDTGGDGSKLHETPMQEPEELLVRDFRITVEILEKIGYTQGCAGCEARLLGTEHRNHTAACRDRLEEQMTRDANMRETFRRRDMRVKKP